MVRSSLLLAFALGATHGLAAQERDTVRLSPVVVTATRLPTPASALEATVTVLDGEELRQQGVRHVAEALRQVPGLAVVQTGSYGALTAVFVRGGESDHLKVLVDGVPLNDPGGAVDLADLTLESVERVEIVRGPVSVLYGSDAMAGVIHVITRRGSGPTRAHVGLRAGTYGTRVADGGLAGGSDAVTYGFSLSRSTTDGVLAFNNGYDNSVLSGSLSARPDARTDMTLSLRYGDSEFHFPTEGGGSVVDRNAFRFQDRFTGALDVGYRFAARVEGRVLLTLSEADGGVDDRPDGPADTLGFFGFQSVQAVTRRGADARVHVYLGAANVLTVGAQVEEQGERSTSESLSEFGASTASLNAARLNRGYYAQVHARTAPGLAVTAGARLDDNEAFGTFVTYRGGATYAFASGTRVRASIGKGFKEPTFFENFAASPFARGNPALAPERATTWEVGIEQGLAGGRVQVAAAYFSQRFRNLIQFTFAPPEPGAPNYFNVAAADASGLELEAHAIPIPAMALNVSATLLDTRVVDAGFDAGPAAAFSAGERLLRRPATTVALGASYRLRGRARVSASARYVGSRDDVDFSAGRRVALPAFTTVDAAAEVDVLPRHVGPRVALAVRVMNVFDAAYQEVFNFPAPGRAVTVGGSVGF